MRELCYSLKNIENIELTADDYNLKENYACRCAFLSVKTEGLDCPSPDGQPPYAQKVIERHRQTIDLCMLCSKKVFLLHRMSATTGSDTSD
jgi:hypothetical protein